jgi:hypothetical protein
MPYRLIWEADGVEIRYSGVVSDDDILQANLGIVKNPEFESIKFEIGNYSNVTKFSVSSDIVRWVAEYDRRASKRNPSVRVALVGESLELRGLVNMYLIHRDSDGGTWDQRQFATLEKARAWVADSARRPSG